MNSKASSGVGAEGLLAAAQVEVNKNIKKYAHTAVDITMNLDFVNTKTYDAYMFGEKLNCKLYIGF